MEASPWVMPVAERVSEPARLVRMMAWCALSMDATKAEPSVPEDSMAVEFESAAGPTRVAGADQPDCEAESVAVTMTVTYMPASPAVSR